jgi:hypothetical protein
VYWRVLEGLGCRAAAVWVCGGGGGGEGRRLEHEEAAGQADERNDALFLPGALAVAGVGVQLGAQVGQQHAVVEQTEAG